MLLVIPASFPFIVDRGLDADWFYQALRSLRTRPCILARAGHSTLIRYGEQLYR